jgi:hypothetical protein
MKNNCAKAFHILPYMQLTFTVLHWKQNLLLLGRLLLVVEYQNNSEICMTGTAKEIDISHLGP